jgi:hypothetical protein
MKREGYEPAFIAAIIAPPRPSPRWCRRASPRWSMAPSATSRSRPVHGRRGAGLMIGFGLMIYCYFFGPPA